MLPAQAGIISGNHNDLRLRMRWKSLAELLSLRLVSKPTVVNGKIMKRGAYHQIILGMLLGLWFSGVALIAGEPKGPLGAGGLPVTEDQRRYKVSEVAPADPWKVRYELGPGDSLNFRLHGRPELTQAGVAVGPDGTISYLQARRVSVFGKTITELGKEMEEVLEQFHRDTTLIITPAALGSKKFTILGQVRQNGTYPLVKPISLLEAIANSGGAEIGVRATSGETGAGGTGGDRVGLVDFDNSFVLRNGKMLDVDLGDLYLRGDITQNVQIEAGDYIYLASNLLNEVYVFGSVGAQGSIPFQHELTVMGAISSAGGYAPFAWKRKILIVRGSLTDPTYLVVDTGEILNGSAKNVPLEPGDIVYVNSRPWKFGEQLLDAVIVGLVQGYAYKLADEVVDDRNR